MIALLPVEAPSAGTDYTQIFVTLIVTGGVIVTAILSYLGVKAGREGVKAAEVAANVAAKTERSNSADHGKVAERLDRQDRTLERVTVLLAEIKDDLTHMDARMHDLGKRQVALTDHSVSHLQWHVDHPPKESP